MRAICTYAGCTKATTNDWDIRPSVAVKALSANILWMNGWTDLHDWTCIGKYSSIHFQWYIMCLKVISIGRDTGISM